MKKVGICACYDTFNYGSMLQALVTQRAIERLGYNSEFIVYKKKKTVLFVLKQIPRLFNTNLMFDKMLMLKKKIALRLRPYIKEQDEVRKQAFKRFQNQYYKAFSEGFYGYEELLKGARNYSTVLVGSDQLWTPGGLPTNFYNLMFVPEDINKVSYATSFGVNSIPWYQIGRTKKFLERINHLSVREQRGAEIIRELTDCDVKVVADPTMLLTSQEWDELIPYNKLIKEPYIFCYFLGVNSVHRDIAEEFSKVIGMKIVCTPYLDSFVKRDMRFGDEQLFDIGPDDFVNLIRGAEYVLTDSFHGSVFSILYHKKFITFNRFMEGKQSRNSRIDSLCSMLGLENRRYCTDIVKEIEEVIDYSTIDDTLDMIREESIRYLKSSLK